MERAEHHSLRLVLVASFYGLLSRGFGNVTELLREKRVRPRRAGRKCETLIKGWASGLRFLFAAVRAVGLIEG